MSDEEAKTTETTETPVELPPAGLPEAAPEADKEADEAADEATTPEDETAPEKDVGRGDGLQTPESRAAKVAE
jgi:hypothetical protein